jgi:pyridoxamine 5'-phosphate oxidase family protein
MTLNDTEIRYLNSQRLGRLATAQPDGTLQNNPVGFRYNIATATIDINGFNMAASRKFRNLAENNRVAFVVDDVVSIDPWRVRCLEIRGWAEAIDPASDKTNGLDAPIIRIHPQRILSFGLDEPDVEAHQLTFNRRTVS